MTTINKAHIKAAIAHQMEVAPSVRRATSTLLDSVTMAPEVKVELVEDDSLDDGPGAGRGWGYESRTMTVTGYLVTASTSSPGASLQAAETITDELFEAARDGLKLGLAYVQDCALMSAEMGDIEVGNDVFYGARLTWIVKVTEYDVTRTADPVGWS